ncbi:type VI secretion system-associated protein VasI [Larsenimonas suaedae]|uniref:Type VI secretion system-associated protein VasI n=1 Tax=Larsenimonas suaedae TaxID=1851019 RepID=A0ABU1GVR8_9GAMM|nr:type VI secretion system-associated protein VasI [Larsenimonas suaedae]MCM2973210.1 type VI secretion system-associated protein TagO [Larsenimonas suaedae]MDR5896103.1 type VI secretion system-associated protein VasI [Larsenimonas suaedae]
MSVLTPCRIVALVALAFLTLAALPAQAETSETAAPLDTGADEAGLERQARECAAIGSRLARLKCFDDLFPGNPATMASSRTTESVDAPVIAQPPFWQDAKALEGKRTDQSAPFLEKRWASDGGFEGNMMMTAPALGTTPPRPLLVIGCVDNITRLQFDVDAPLSRTRIPVRLQGDRGSIEQTWRLTDNGYAVSAGRGLPAIDTLKWMLRQSSIELSSSESALNGLVFELGDLANRIKPMRSLCHW